MGPYLQLVEYATAVEPVTNRGRPACRGRSAGAQEAGHRSPTRGRRGLRRAYSRPHAPHETRTRLPRRREGRAQARHRPRLVHRSPGRPARRRRRRRDPRARRPLDARPARAPAGDQPRRGPVRPAGRRGRGRRVRGPRRHRRRHGRGRALHPVVPRHAARGDPREHPRDRQRRRPGRRLAVLPGRPVHRAGRARRDPRDAGRRPVAQGVRGHRLRGGREAEAGLPDARADPLRPRPGDALRPDEGERAVGRRRRRAARGPRVDRALGASRCPPHSTTPRRRSRDRRRGVVLWCGLSATA
jgi:hypothetical protein